MLSLVLGMRVSRSVHWVLGAGLLLVGCILNPQPLPPELAADGGSTNYGDDAALGGDGANAPDSGKGVVAGAGSDGSAQEGGDASDGALDALEEGG